MPGKRRLEQGQGAGVQTIVLSNAGFDAETRAMDGSGGRARQPWGPVSPRSIARGSTEWVMRMEAMCPGTVRT